MQIARVWRAVHLSVGVLACLVVPVVTRVASPEGGLSWTMFARARRYRLQLVAVTASGARRSVPALAVARALGPPQGALVAGLESGVTASASGTLRRALPDLARIACETAPDALTVEALLEEQDVGSAAADTRHTETATRCAR